MKKYLIRKEFLKLKTRGKSYKECQKELFKDDKRKYAVRTLKRWWKRYNHDRSHQSLHGLTPAEVYFQFKRHKKHYEL